MANCQCKGNTLSPLDRREFLTVGALGMLGITLGDLLRARRAQADEPPPRRPTARLRDLVSPYGVRPFVWQQSSNHRVTRAVQPVWWLAPSPWPVSPWKYS